MDNDSLLAHLNPKQQEICTSGASYILTACPGSGKTRTITYRMAYLQQEFPHSRKLNIAITYTNRAAEEIDHRLDELGIDRTGVWTGTIHQFCMHFIIRPYAMYSPRLKTGYRIIDEYVTRAHCRAIAAELGIRCGRKDPLSFPEIREAYDRLLVKNRELDFDQILSVSLELVRTCPFICENVAGIIRSIHVDEYQDTREVQYQILAGIVRANTAIQLLFVGDVNQAIYGSLGSVAKSPAEIRALYPLEFREDTLTGCYRSTQRLIDWYTRFEVQPTGARAVSDIRDARGVITYDQTIAAGELSERIARIIEDQLRSGVPPTQICVAAPQWRFLYPVVNALKQRLPGVPFNAPDITPFQHDRMNPFYLLARLTFTKPGPKSTFRKRIAGEFLEILERDYQTALPDCADANLVLKAVNSAVDPETDALTCLDQVVTRVFQRLRISLEQSPALSETYAAFLENTRQRIERYALPYRYADLVSAFREKEGVVISSLHGLKGEEYHSVIAYGLLEGLVPNRQLLREDPPAARQEARKLLYVLCSRAKQALYLFSETGRKGQGNVPYTPSTELLLADFDYDPPAADANCAENE